MYGMTVISSCGSFDVPIILPRSVLMSIQRHGEHMPGANDTANIPEDILLASFFSSVAFRSILIFAAADGGEK